MHWLRCCCEQSTRIVVVASAQVLRNDAEATKAAAQAATLEREAAENGAAVDDSELERLLQEQARALEAAAQVSRLPVIAFVSSERVSSLACRSKNY